MEALIINSLIFIVTLLCLLGIKKRFFDVQEDSLFKKDAPKPKPKKAPKSKPKKVVSKTNSTS